MLRSRSTGNRMFLSIAVTAVTICLFSLPYYVPVSPNLSDSYLFGFNNRFCWLLFLALVSLMALVGPVRSDGTVSGKPLSRSTLQKALVGNLVCSTAMYLWTRKLNGFGEAIYLIDRLRLVMEGRVPYRDFEYAYGVGFLYPPAWLAHLLHLGAADAYGLFYIVVSLLGTLLLYICLLWMDGIPASKRQMFLFLWIVSLVSVLNFGVNYSLLRFDLPIFWMLLIHRAVARRSGSSLVPFALASLGYGIVLCDSPELAIAFGFGASLYLAFVGRLRIVMNAVWFALMLFTLAAISEIGRRLGAFRTTMAFRLGGGNFPVIPAPHILLFLLAAGIVACQVGLLVRTRKTGTALPLFAFSLVATAAALGRCDPGHVLLNGLSLFLVAGMVTSSMRLPWNIYVPMLWLVFLVIPTVLSGRSIADALGKAALPTIFAIEPNDQLSTFDHWVFRRMERQLGEKLAAEKFAETRSAAHRPPGFSLDKLYDQAAGTIYEAPYGFSLTHFGLYHAADVEEGYFSEMTNVVTPEQVEQKVSELKAHPERPLLLLAGRENFCTVSIVTERTFISTLFLFPYHAKAVNVEGVSEPLCSYIRLHYKPTVPADAAHFGYALWSPVH